MSIQYAILGFLSWRPSTGYDLKKLFEESTFMYWSGNNNQIYKSLLTLQEEGLVTNETIHQEGAPSKKVYTITKAGIERLKSWVTTSPEAPEFRKPFLVQLAWSDLLTNQELSKLLSDYENEVQLQLIMHQERKRRGIPSPNRTPRETLIWNMITDNLIFFYQNELEWIQNTSKALFHAPHEV
ncbi:MAG: putative transcriptional regulator [Herbinix sp.]|jgi:DNA-binding PadR family transcriptional regulator|nr:putative transcriptional regulator [Herbinix sp.]